MKKLSDSMQWKKAMMLAAKIALGSSLAIYVAYSLNLENAASAGIITLLTLLTTKKGTSDLALYRLITFMIVEVVTLFTFLPLGRTWVAYGIFAFLVVLICERMGWRATISTNAVIGTHCLMTEQLTPTFFLNELLLVTIGVTFAFFLNMIHDNQGQKERFVKSIRMVEARMQCVLEEMAGYLTNRCPDETQKSAWTDVSDLRTELVNLLGEAWEYEENTYEKDGGYYVSYFEMRLDQCRTLLHLHGAMRKIKTVPRQAKVIEDYIRYLIPFVTETNVPGHQMKRLEDIFLDMKKEPLPISREEFENRALLYHVLMDLEEFLSVKKRFIDHFPQARERK